jgi:hypothetical protein
MKKHLLEKTALFVCAIVGALAPSVRSQEKSNTAPQTGSSAAKAKPAAEEAAVTNRLSISQTNQGAGRDAHGEKTGTVGTRAATAS